ncbi:hypothetical protein [Pseudotabrizicola algicola]|uniref:Uncharacterized protein n=1 Tax=Pseudotabrizicola algicola TaxID=2709381 RepID=A0A6B3RJ48_9RHOB|nr:hypothetical protein [Pseudotabrizicola algicola]NEX45216.1 hypothetical protein [Pseudotabrizicola algicola]
MTAPLAALSDRDLMLNLWFSLLAITSDDDSKIDPARCEQFVIRDGMTPNEGLDFTTLADLMSEAEGRCNIPWLLMTIKAGHIN